VREGPFPEALIPGETFDIVAFNDVFEHLPEPALTLQACEIIINPGGLLILNVPDSDGVLYFIASALAKARLPGPLRRLWQVELPSPHVSYFNRSNLQALVGSHTHLKKVHDGRLQTVTAQGLRERIGTKMPRSLAITLHLGLLPLVAVQDLLPSDILLQIYVKPG
jgi:SAM-dependent methyltransferase